MAFNNILIEHSYKNFVIFEVLRKFDDSLSDADEAAGVGCYIIILKKWTCDR